MTSNSSNHIADIFARDEKTLLEDWLREQLAALSARQDLISANDLRKQSSEFLALITPACAGGNLTNITAPEWKAALNFLADVSRGRAGQGLSPSETATFIFSLKQPLFTRLRQELGSNAGALADELWSATVLIDKLGLYTTEVFQLSRETVIKRQNMDMIELSTPVIRLWDDILAVPLIGTLDSARMQKVMENLLQTIVDTNSSIAIVDITGVPAVDTLVAQHLLKTVAAARLMGAQCILSGIRPQIAQAVIHLGVQFGEVVTKATLADALVYAFKQSGRSIIQQTARS